MKERQLHGALLIQQVKEVRDILNNLGMESMNGIDVAEHSVRKIFVQDRQFRDDLVHQFWNAIRTEDVAIAGPSLSLMSMPDRFIEGDVIQPPSRDMTNNKNTRPRSSTVYSRQRATTGIAAPGAAAKSAATRYRRRITRAMPLPGR